MGETEYNLRLMNEQKRRPKPKRKCFVFSCKEDLNKWSIYSFFEQLERSLKESCLKRIRKDLDDLRNRWLTTSNKVIKKDSESLRKEVEKRIPGLDFEYGESSPWKFDDMTGEINKRKFIFSQSWEKAKKDPIKIMINEIIETEKIKKNVYYKFYNEDSFWKKVNQFIKQNIKKEV